MARKSVKVLRTTEILDAFEICTARLGFNNVTLADIGEQAGIQRPAIRHFIGNREKVVEALAQRYVDQAARQVNALNEMWPTLNLNSKSVIASLLTEAVMVDESKFITLGYLFILARTNENISQLMQAWVRTYADFLTKVLIKQYQGSQVKLSQIAYSVISMSIGLSTLSSIDATQYSKLITGAIVQQLSVLKPR